MIEEIKITAVNKPHGTMAVMFNNDPELEWNFPIPTDEYDVPIEGDEMLKILISLAYEPVLRAYIQRAADEVRMATDFGRFEKLKRKTFKVKAMVKEYEQAREGQETVEDLPPAASEV